MRAFTVINAAQRSPEWFAARCGRLTSTGASSMLATIAKGEAAGRRDLRTRLVLERLTGQVQEDGFVSADMVRGVELEADAFGAFEALTGEMVTRVGFLQHNEQMAGTSPDGVIGDFDSVVEIKVPKSSTHLAYLRAGTVPSNHMAQITHHLYVSGAARCHFFSFAPQFPDGGRTFHAVVRREDVDLTAYALTVSLFLSEVEKEANELIERIQQRRVA